MQVDPVIAREDDRTGTVTRFRKLAWTRSNNAKWINDLLTRPSMRLGHTKNWSPWRKEVDRRRGPHLYLKVDGPLNLSTDSSLDWQSLTLALRHDVLAESDQAAQRLLDGVPDYCGTLERLSSTLAGPNSAGTGALCESMVSRTRLRPS